MLVTILFFLILIFLVVLLLYLGYYILALIFAYLLFFLLSIVVLLVIVETFRVFKGDAPYLPTPRKLIKKIIAEIDFTENANVYELGCGNAIFLRLLSKQKKIRGIGYEYFLVPYLAAKAACLFKPQIKIYCKNFFKVDLSGADYVFCFLLGQEMDRLEIKLKKELKSGAVVISNTFTFKNWQPERIIYLDENKKKVLSNNIYIYRQP